MFDVYRRVAESGGIDGGPIFELVQSLDVRHAPSFPHFRALTVEAAEAEDEAEDHECAKCHQLFPASEIISVGSNDTARDLGVKIGDEVCLDCGE